MQNKNSLAVCRGQEHVGNLWLDPKNQFTFQYSSSWLDKPNPLPVSLAQSIQSSPIEADRLRPFFVNLLPEDEVRKTLVSNLKISADSDFHLLSALAGDCVGNLTIFPANNLPNENDIYRAISRSDLEEKISKLKDKPLLVDEQNVRLSISGKETKLPVFIKNQEYFIPMNGAPSSHILKSGYKDFTGAIENEAYCTELGRLLGVNVVNGKLLKGESTHYLIERTDRKRTADGYVNRLHQEDFCQMLNIAPSLKYEKEGGPSLNQCFELIRRYSVNPIIDINLLLKWVVFNYLIGNHDAHAKNLAFVVSLGGPRLAPFCDLMSTSIYQGTGQPLAMRIGGEDRPSWIIARRWENFANDVNIKPKYVKLMLATMANQIVDCGQRLAEKYLRTHSDGVVTSIHKVIKTRARNALTNLSAANIH